MDDHTRAKHAILRKYLDAWIPIMTSYGRSVLVIDGFAGPGEYIGGEIGSPLIMIDALLEHAYQQVQQRPVRFLFVEADLKRYEHLKQLVDAYKEKHLFPPGMKYEFYNGRFDAAMTDLLGRLANRTLQTDGMFIFIDPFGYSHTPMRLIQQLMRHDKSEVLITLMSEEINRFVTADYSTKDQQYDELFGTREWRQIAEGTPDATERMHRQQNLYRHQLINTAGAKYVRSFRMRNKHNATDYFLFFGTKSLKGLSAMKRAMWKVDPTGAYDFSDFTNPYQPLLLTEINYADLQRMLIDKFKGKTASIEEIEEYVIAETPYVSYKKEALAPLEATSPPQIRVISTDPKRRPGTFVERKTTVQFL